MKVGIAGIMQQSADNRNEAEMAAANERTNPQAAANNASQYTAAMPATSMPAMHAEPAQTTDAFANMAVTSEEPIAAAAVEAAPEEVATVYDDASGTFV